MAAVWESLFQFEADDGCELTMENQQTFNNLAKDESIILTDPATTAITNADGLIVEMDDAHPGLIVALNASKMDASLGLSGSDSSTESVPCSSTIEAASTAATKRDVTSLMAPSQFEPVKKQKVIETSQEKTAGVCCTSPTPSSTNISMKEDALSAGTVTFSVQTKQQISETSTNTLKVSAPTAKAPVDELKTDPSPASPFSETSATDVNLDAAPVKEAGNWIISPTTGVKVASSEADFADFAASSVASIIKNASNKVPADSKVAEPDENTVDISTTRIKALTSNWIAALNSSSPPDPSASELSFRNGNSRTDLTTAERAKLLRDRNRDHARNTRMRKKAYVEEMKRTLTALVIQRDTVELQRQREAKTEAEQREVRFRVVAAFLKLCGSSDTNLHNWVAIIDQDFVLTHPRVSHDCSSAPSSELVLRDPVDVMNNSKCLPRILAKAVGDSNDEADCLSVHISYNLDRSRFLMDGHTTFVDFSATSVGLADKGASKEVVFDGSMRSTFNPLSNKLTAVDIKFDTGLVHDHIDELKKQTCSFGALDYLKVFDGPTWQVSDISSNDESMSDISQGI